MAAIVRSSAFLLGAVFLAIKLVLGAPSVGWAESGFLYVSPETVIPLERALYRQPGFGLEWWYLTGHLRGDGGEFGFELTFFRVSAPAVPTDDPFSTEDVYIAHFAVTDPVKKTFYFDERSSRGAFGEAGAAVDATMVWVRDWRLEGRGDGAYRLRASSGGYGLELDLVPLKPPVRHGADGYSRKGDDPREASYYVSWTRLRAEGRMRVPAGETWRAVKGEAWIDREISTPPDEPEAVGWDWFAIQLDGESELMLYRILRKDGSVSPWSGGTWIPADDPARPLSAKDIRLTPGRKWTSPRSSVVYDTSWNVDVPSLDLTLAVTADVEAQELFTTRSTGNAYWEGKCTVTGFRQGLPVSGRAYLEMNRSSLPRGDGRP